MNKLLEILDGKHPTYQTGKLKALLLRHGIVDNICEECHISEYNGKPIVVQLDHINGKSDDHRRENLRMLCPNCHSQTETYGSKNWKNKQRLKLASKKQMARECATKIREERTQTRLNDIERSKKTRGWITELARKWNISHTSVIRFVKIHSTLCDKGKTR